MWDNASLLRAIANLLFGVSLMLVLYGTARYVMRLPVFPLRTVDLATAPLRASAAQMEQVVHEQISGNFFTVDLERTRLVFEKLPWVRKVSVRRKFPWSLEVEVEEHVPMASWNGTALVNSHGEIFMAQLEQSLPLFIGQPDTSIQMAKTYAELNEVLQPMKQQIAQISLSPRFAWQVRLDNGMVLELGKDEIQQRMVRFVTVYPYSLASLTKSANHVDLRYRNGFAAYLPGGSV